MRRTHHALKLACEIRSVALVRAFCAAHQALAAISWHVFLSKNGLLPSPGSLGPPNTDSEFAGTMPKRLWMVPLMPLMLGHRILHIAVKAAFIIFALCPKLSSLEFLEPASVRPVKTSKSVASSCHVTCLALTSHRPPSLAFHLADHFKPLNHQMNGAR